LSDIHGLVTRKYRVFLVGRAQLVYLRSKAEEGGNMTAHVREILDQINKAWDLYRKNGLNPENQAITLSYGTMKALINEIEDLSFRLEGLEK
jgi:hypothetical protein